jgi:hypothetical protein
MCYYGLSFNKLLVLSYFASAVSTFNGSGCIVIRWSPSSLSFAQQQAIQDEQHCSLQLGNISQRGFISLSMRQFLLRSHKQGHKNNIIKVFPVITMT